MDMVEEIPNYLLLYFGTIGIGSSKYIIGDSWSASILRSRIYHYTIWILLLLTLLTGTVLRPVIESTLVSKRNSLNEEVSSNLLCSSTLSASAKHPPCIYVYSIQLVSPLLGITAVVVYFWIMFYGLSERTITHLNSPHVLPHLNAKCVSLLKILLAQVIYILISTPLYELLYLATFSSLASDNIFGAIWISIVLAVGIVVNLSPFYGFALLFYGEFIYLQNLVTQFIDRNLTKDVKLNNFDFKETTQKYTFLLKEFTYVQNEFGPIATFFAICLLAVLLMTAITAVYLSKIVAGFSKFYFSMNVIRLSSYILIYILPLMYLVLFIAILNRAALHVEDVCFKILSLIPSKDEVEDEVEEVEVKNEAVGKDNFNQINEADSSLHSPSSAATTTTNPGLPSPPAITSHPSSLIHPNPLCDDQAPPPPPPQVSASLISIDAAEMFQKRVTIEDMVRFIKLIEKRPCEILLFDYRLTQDDLKKLIAVVVLIVFFCITGLDWLIPT